MAYDRLKNKLRTFKVEHFAIMFLVVGIIILYFLSLASKPVFVKEYSELDKYEGKTVIIKGIVIDFDTTKSGEGIVTVLEPYDLESTLKVFIESCNCNFTMGDIIQAKGSVLRLSDELYELVVVNEKDIEKTGHWHSHRLSIPELAHRLEHNPAEFKHLPVQVTGYLKYEPRVPASSISLTDHPNKGLYTVKVSLPDAAAPIVELHKGDLVSLNVSIEYNENNFEYKLILKNLTLLERYGHWELTLAELCEAPFVFEGATVNLSGYVYEYKEHYNYILLFDAPAALRSKTNVSIWVDISGLNLTGIMLQKDYYITINGALYYDPQYLDYAVKANNIYFE